MALLFMDSFDHYATADVLAKWSSISAGTWAISPATGRHGSASLRFTTGFGSGSPWAVKGVTSSSPIAVLGVAGKFSALSTYYIGGFSDGPSQRDQVLLRMNSDGSITALRGTATSAAPGSGSYVTLGSTAAGVLTAGGFAYIELKVLLSATVGTVTLRVNGVVVLALTAQNTANTVLTWTAAWIGAPNTPTGSILVDYDDLYVLDGSGAAPWNDFLGDCRVDARAPTGAGATTGWTPSAGANWAAVDDAAPNADTDYVAATAVGLTDTYATQDAPVPGAIIYGVQHNLSLKKSDAGTCTVAPVIRHSGVDYPGVDLAPGTSYAYGVQVAQVNPGTGAAWTEAGFNAAEFGLKRTA